MNEDLQNSEPQVFSEKGVGDSSVARQVAAGRSESTQANATPEIAVALLTGGIDRPYTFGLGMELIAKGAVLDVIGSDSLDFREFHTTPGINFLNLQSNQRSDVNVIRKVWRLASYYAKVIHYAASSKPKIFHILWNNKFQAFDRTLLTLFYRLLGKKIVLTVHNVNAARRDARDTFLNRLTLRIQYLMAHHIFVHTRRMKIELSEEFDVPGGRVTVIPFGINNAVPNTCLTRAKARQQLSIHPDKKTILFFGRIAPYKGLEFLVDAFQKFLTGHEYQLVIVGRPENSSQSYWSEIQERIREDVRLGRIVLRAEHIPDGETEIYFKAADVLVLPYRQIYQSGVLFLAYSFGLPILAADVGDLKDEIVEGKTGFVFKPEDPVAMTKTIERYFGSDLFLDLINRRQEISNYAKDQYSWDKVGQMIMRVYAGLLRPSSLENLLDRDESRASVDPETHLRGR